MLFYWFCMGGSFGLFMNGILMGISWIIVLFEEWFRFFGCCLGRVNDCWVWY